MTDFVPNSPDLDRILALPERSWLDSEIEQACDVLTKQFKKPGGTMTLRPIQAESLLESVGCGGLLAGIGVGHGKTLLSILLPLALNAVRPLLIVPASLVAKTKSDIRNEYSDHFFLHGGLRIISYEKLSSAKSAEYLERLNPDVIIADECHKLKDPKAARTRRFLRYMRANTHVKFFGMSGTLTRKSLQDYRHLAMLALHDECPVPCNWNQGTLWAEALDSATPDWKRPKHGALIKLAQKYSIKVEGDTLEAVRLGYRERFRRTPGIVMTSDASVDCALTINVVDVEVPEEIKDAISLVRETWETPNGDELTEAIQLWATIRQLSQGMFYRWDPEPPKHWMSARKERGRFIRDVLSRNTPGLDSPSQVAEEFYEHKVFVEWERVREDYIINTIPVFINDYLMQFAAKWLNKHRGIVWVEHRAVGVWLSEISGFPYYGGGEDASRKILHERGPCIVSIKAHGTGKNLQHYSRALVLSAPPSGDTWEQMLGRLHRQGQKNDVVFDLCLHVEELDVGFEQALLDANYIESTTGNRQKLLYSERVGF